MWMTVLPGVGWKASVFDWSEYLAHCGAEAAPADVFALVS